MDAAVMRAWWEISGKKKQVSPPVFFFDLRCYCSLPPLTAASISARVRSGANCWMKW